MISLITDTILIPWHVRLIASFKSAAFGILIALLSLPLFVLNEYQAFHDTQLIKVLNEDLDNRDNDYQYLQAETKTSSELVDEIFGVKTDGIHLNRTVFMYQWQEVVKSKTKKKIGGKEEIINVYDYVKTFASHPIDSSKFKEPQGHENPPFKFQSTHQTQKSVSLGDYNLSSNLLGYLNYFEPLDIKNINAIQVHGLAYLQNNHLFMGSDPDVPQIGNYKIKFEHVPNRQISLIAQVDQNIILPISNGLFPIFQFIQPGDVSAKELIQIYKDETGEFTWIVRFVAFVMLFSGLFMLVYPLIVFCDFVPFLSSFVHKPLFSLVFIVAAILALCTLTLSWIFVRPILAGTTIILMATVYSYRSYKKLADQIESDYDDQDE
ncbi:MAG: TMEM43 family protein [Candidatus Cloacimonetes bacterium]|nr:TMEM43 family protein [Candidatus Cloacimonadota bacterium]